MKTAISIILALCLIITPVYAMADEMQNVLNSYNYYFSVDYIFYETNDYSIEAYTKQNNQPLFVSNGSALYYNDEQVYSYVGNPEILFFAAGDTIYRYHVASRVVDLMLSNEEAVWFYPVTAHTVLYAEGVVNHDGIVCSKATDSSLEYYYYDDLTGVSKSVADPNHSIALTGFPGDYNIISNSEIVPYAAGTTINGKAIPHASYPEGSKFTGSFAGETQCHGFALFIYDYLWGSTSYGRQSRTIAIDDWTATAKAALQVPNGSLIRVDSGESSQHTMILISKTSSSITVYHANWTNGEVRITNMSYSNFVSRYDTINYIKIPASSCPHSRSYEKYSGTQHVIHCVLCGNNPTYSNHYSNSSGYSSCLACGFVGDFSSGTNNIQSEGHH